MTVLQVQVPRNESTALRAGLYGRASSDPKKRGRSIKDQFAVGELDCLDRGWTIADRYEDRDRSATRRARKVREDWERLIADAESGQLDVIVYAERSRASRDMEVSMKLRSLCERTGVLLCYDGRVYNMRIPADRKDFTRDAVASEEEGETTIMRAERTARLNAMRGAPHGKIPFGFARKYDEDDGHLIGQFPHHEHAAVVLDLFERADRQESFSSLEAILAKYIPLSSRYGLRYILTNPAYIGMRSHKGTLIKGTWDGIVPLDLFNRVQLIAKDPKRRTQKDTRAKHRLSGIARCVHCRTQEAKEPTLRRTAPDVKASSKEGYNCRTGHVGIGLVVLDAYVEEALLAWLSSSAAAAAFAPPDQDTGEVEKLVASIAVLKAQIEEGRTLAGTVGEDGLLALSALSLARMERALLPVIKKAEGQLQQLTSAGDPVLDRVVAVSPELIQKAWDSLTIAQKRHVIRRSVNVTLNSASARGTRTVEDGRITLRFAGQEGFEAVTARGVSG